MSQRYPQMAVLISTIEAAEPLHGGRNRGGSRCTPLPNVPYPPDAETGLGSVLFHDLYATVQCAA